MVRGGRPRPRASSPAGGPRPDLARRWTRWPARPPHASGMYYNWYDPQDGSVVTVWPDDGSTIYPFLSSVDNGWLAAALRVVEGAVPELRGKADRILRQMNFGFYYNPAAQHAVRCQRPDRAAASGTRRRPAARLQRDGGLVHLQPLRHHGDRAADRHATSASGPARSRRRPTSTPCARCRTPATGTGTRCSRSASTRTYLGVPVYEGSYQYRGIQFVPSWGGDMFEALMPDLFVPEERWAPEQLGPQPPGHRRRADRARAQRRRLRLLGLLPRQQPDRRLRRLRRRRDGHGHQRLPVRRGGLEVRRRLRRLPSGRSGSPTTATAW